MLRQYVKVPYICWYFLKFSKILRKLEIHDEIYMFLDNFLGHEAFIIGFSSISFTIELKLHKLLYWGTIIEVLLIPFLNLSGRSIISICWYSWLKYGYFCWFLPQKCCGHKMLLFSTVWARVLVLSKLTII